MSSNLGTKALESKIEDYVESVLPQATIDIVNNSAAQIDLIDKLYDNQFSDFAIATNEIAPYTSIQNRAKVCNTLKSMAGIERIKISGINLLDNEFGPAGQQVFEPTSKDSRVRFVGTGWTPVGSAYGAYVESNLIINNFIEVTFYGSGLDLLTIYRGVATDVRMTVDNGVESSNIFGTILSDVLGNRNYTPNMIVPLVSELALDWHTVKLRLNTATSIYTCGFQILNNRSDLAVYSGSGVSKSGTTSLASLTSSSFNSGIVGTRGARVIKYLQAGAVSSAVQEVNATTQYLALTDHTNEEVLRRINFREFGANRADDFQTLAAVVSDRYFTLDDGTTTLVGNDVALDSTTLEGVMPSTNSGAFLTITFVGTGLDVFWSGNASGVNSTANAFEVFVNGISVGNWSTVSSTGLAKIVSGLPYGTHTVKFYRNIPNVWSLKISDFIIYQPKKPSIPVGVFELADYCVLANYSNTNTLTAHRVPVGVIRKMSVREFLPFGTWTASVNAMTPSGAAINSSTVGSYIEYKFWGTGFNYRFGNNAGAQSFTVSVNGSANLSSLTTSSFVVLGLSFTASTGTMSGAPTLTSAENNLSVTGLTLGFHTMRIAWISGAVTGPNCIDIITPIYFQPSDHKIGSSSVGSTVKFSSQKALPVAGPDLSKAKAWVYFDRATGYIHSSYNVSAVLAISTYGARIFFEKPFKSSAQVIAIATGDYPEIQYDRPAGGRYGTGAFIDIYTTTSAGAAVSTSFNVVCFGELFDE